MPSPLRPLVLAAFAAAALLALVAPPPARANGDAVGDLLAGGIAKGDISSDAGETDRISVDLTAGAALDVTFKAGFEAFLTLTDPDGAPVDLAFTQGSVLRARGLPVAASGRYEFTISSADGSQGLYTLIARQRWARSMTVSGVGLQDVEFGLLAAGRVSATIRRERNAPGQPQILSLIEPGGADLLTAPIDARGSTVRLPPTTAAASGMYRLTVTSTDGTSGWTGRIRRTTPRIPATKLSLANGINQISFAEDGVAEIFKRRCASCHFWAGGYGGVRGYARESLSRIKSGNMPPDGKLPAEQISLIQSWISTGMAR